MSDWRPILQGRPGPRYRAIADALAEDIETGRVAPGVRLPTHRDLAFRLGVTIGTVTRAYREAERRGLTAGEVGRGTFVRAPAPAADASTPPEPLYHFGMNSPMGGSEARCFAQALKRVADDPKLADLAGYPTGQLDLLHRAAVARFMTGLGVPAAPERLRLAAGGQGALAAALDLLTRPGDIIATEELTYPSFKSLARNREVKLRGLACDGEGVLVDAFREAVREGGVKALYCVPTMQNPTGVTWSEERRRAIAAIARANGVAILEDDVYGFLVPERPPSFAALLPELTVHVNAASKSLAPALRIGVLVVPPALAAKLGAVHSIASPLMAEVMRLWIEDGTADRLMEEKRREGAARQALVRGLLDPAGIRYAPAHPNASHLWLRLPEGWRDDAVAAAAARRGILVNPAWAFAVGRTEQNAIRLCFSRPAQRSDIERGVELLIDCLAGSPEEAAPLV